MHAAAFACVYWAERNYGHIAPAPSTRARDTLTIGDLVGRPGKQVRGKSAHGSGHLGHRHTHLAEWLQTKVMPPAFPGRRSDPSHEAAAHGLALGAAAAVQVSCAWGALPSSRRLSGKPAWTPCYPHPPIPFTPTGLEQRDLRKRDLLPMEVPAVHPVS